MVVEQRQLKQQVDELVAQEQQLRAREAEVSALVTAEDAQWRDLNSRLDELERALASRPR
jgi:hypothetical protein